MATNNDNRLVHASALSSEEMISFQLEKVLADKKKKLRKLKIRKKERRQHKKRKEKD